MAWKVLEIRDCKWWASFIVGVVVFESVEYNIRNIIKKRSEELATAKTRGGKKKYVVSGCLFGLENEKIHICLYLSSKTTLDKACTVVADQDFMFYLFCHDNVPKEKRV